jgi:hypothetical protein
MPLARSGKSRETPATAAAVPNFDELVFGVWHRDRPLILELVCFVLGVRYSEYRSDPSLPEVAILLMARVLRSIRVLRSRLKWPSRLRNADR